MLYVILEINHDYYPHSFPVTYFHPTKGILSECRLFLASLSGAVVHYVSSAF